MKTYKYRRLRRGYGGYKGCNQTTQRTLEKQQNTRRSHGSPMLTGSAAAFTKPSTSRSPEHEGGSTEPKLKKLPSRKGYKWNRYLIVVVVRSRG